MTAQRKVLVAALATIMAALLVLGSIPTVDAQRVSSHPRTPIINEGPSAVYVARFTDTLPDGGVVYCYTYKSGFGGGISCLRQVP